MKKIFYILPFFALLTGCSLDDNVEEAKKSIVTCPMEWNSRAVQLVSKTNEMSWRLLRESLSEEKNTLVSPLSLAACLAMLENGAESETAAQIREFLGYGDFEESEFNECFRTILQGLPNLDTSVDFRTANSLWYEQTLTPQADFKERLSYFYKAEMKAVDFSKNDKAKDAINAWCKEKTEGLIPQFLDYLEPATKSMIINAIYLNAPWNKPFDEKLTKKEQFHLRDGSTLKTDFMHRTAEALAVNNEAISMVRLPMGKFSKYATFFALPKEGLTLSEAAVAVQKALGDAVNKKVPELRTFQVDMSIPKFKVETGGSLKKTLTAMGLTKPFSDCFPNVLEGQSLDLSDIQQKCVFSVSEERVEAAAVTGGFLISSVGPSTTETMELRLDRPFLYGLVELESGCILFLGAMENPAAK